jgi:hypothetical protein
MGVRTVNWTRVRLGYKGQKFEVSYSSMSGDRKVAGWTDDPTGGGLYQMAVMNPGWSNVQINELTDDQKTALLESGR